jgi:hypothetical protein
MSSIPTWNEELTFEGINYIMDSSNGVLYCPETEEEVGQWEPNYDYSVPDNCEGMVTWVDYHAEDRHDEKVSIYLSHSYAEDERCQVAAATTIQKHARRMIVMNMDPTGFEPIPDPAESGEDLDNRSAAQMWPEASEAMLRRDFKEAARGFREAYDKSRGWHTDDSVPFTPQEQLLLELILRAEVWSDESYRALIDEQ